LHSTDPVKLSAKHCGGYGGYYQYYM